MMVKSRQMHFLTVNNFAQWRDSARNLLNQQIAPENVSWSEDASQLSLFAPEDDTALPQPENRPSSGPRVPREFLQLAESVACHRDSTRWHLLYQTLWRITSGEPNLLQLHSDDDILALHKMKKAVTRDAHKMKAFVRFRRLEGVQPETMLAWHRPDHRILQLVAPFFARRFKGMNWTIVTPDESACWDQKELRYGPGAPSSTGPDHDRMEELWKTYYASTFNPARIKIAAMKREMPTRYWDTMPETELIKPLLAEAQTRVEDMIERNEGIAQTAAHYLPKKRNITSLRQAAQSCEACDLCRAATQCVFGEGPTTAKLVLVGEQPGDSEDLAGRPFCGPAGEVLDTALNTAGVSRDRVYVTNVVKHFKFVQRGKRRLHVKPNSREIYACRPWLEQELLAVQPSVLVCLGATAAQALLGRDFRLTKSRGKISSTDWCSKTIATWHPSAILRMQYPNRRSEMLSQLTTDLTLAESHINQ
ncbi:MAG: UdgX family uracil-DNA binding protein [Aureliella sp.]